ncbi:hypothetical protein IWQ60_004758 [Tieghemiomyces parasiticus]|uniref:White collar 2 protein n=1 Tax=Tieghemiomyces parasiticus TaxID=78921 RepID=A0A9W8DTL7_9FUNG|nr:hypothetical protein IWQ60_004758 [Tieghemiomyces parasiticus]
MDHPHNHGFPAGPNEGGGGQASSPFPIFNPRNPGALRQDTTGLRAMSASAQKVTAGLGLPTQYARNRSSGLSHQQSNSGGHTAPAATAISGSAVYQTEFTKRKNWHHRIVNEITDMVHVISPSGRIMFCSPSSVEVVGYTPEELIGRSITEFIHVDDIDTYIREFNMAIIQRDFRLFYRFRKKDDRFILLEVVGHPWFTTDQPGTPSSGPSSDLDIANTATGLNLNAAATAANHQQASQLAAAAAGGTNLAYGPGADCSGSNNPFFGNPTAGVSNSNLSIQSGSSGLSPGSGGSFGQVSAGSGLAGFPVAKCFFSIARPYPMKATSFMDNLLELKLENELLVRQYQQLGGDEDTLLKITGAMNDEFELNHLRNRLMTGKMDYLGGLPDLLDLGTTSLGDMSGCSAGGVTPAPASTTSGVSAGSSGPPTSTSSAMAAAARRKKRRTKTDALEHVCTDCGTVESPEWRKGPQGPKTLCNACGLRWAKKNKKVDPMEPGSNPGSAPTSATFGHFPSNDDM